MTEEFALIDFALVAAPPDRVVQALGQVHALSRARHAGGPGETKGLVGRLFGAARGQSSAPRLFLHSAGHLPPPPLARVMPDELGFGSEQTPFRVTFPIGTARLSLIEFREGDDDPSPICAALSAELPGSEVFRFRLSGVRHAGAETTFHIYLDGRAVRRAASISAVGVAPEAPWQVVDTGIPHAIEAESLPHARARAWEIMTPARQGEILLALGVYPDDLFASGPDRIQAELSPEPGGRPLSAVSALFAPRALEPEPEPEPDAELPEDPTLVVADTQAPGLAAQTGEPDPWEEEVTQILVTAVAHALPEDAQVAWLTDFSERLANGDVEAALDAAHQLIAQGNRPQEECRADAARLDALFGIDQTP